MLIAVVWSWVKIVKTSNSNKTQPNTIKTPKGKNQEKVSGVMTQASKDFTSA